MDSIEALWGYIFIAPVVLGLTIFYIAPAVSSFYLAFTQWDGLTAPLFIGLENFIALFKDEVFIRSMINTIIFTLVSVPFSIACATVIAVLLNQKIKGIVMYRTLFFIPVVTMPIAIGMVWRWLYNSEFGLINYILGQFHLPQPSWLFDEKFALFSIILVSVWMSVGYNTVILLAGLQGISSSYYEAADLDGANEFQKFLRITVPLLTPSLFFVLVMSMINSLQVFDLIFVMIGDNASLLEPTRTVVYSVWENGFKFFNMGYASAQALILFIVILIITIIQMVLQKRWVHYQ
ncbi:carbohydrate ABC transporter permease [Metabacillus bambusae]|uniref:Sugar ABC transporter permease n=1 Tax=Metabacillus bambusae TaxID=2795218 RepID=A0ABS3NA42_9BACI|nr:sugar ABC transporter permease [Metabacillus bambusae]MBO1514854.1 sugar ABC transporter permease [Metabacillus bambusae]